MTEPQWGQPVGWEIPPRPAQPPQEQPPQYGQPPYGQPPYGQPDGHPQYGGQHGHGRPGTAGHAEPAPYSVGRYDGLASEQRHPGGSGQRRPRGPIGRLLAPLVAVGGFIAKFGAVLWKLKALTVAGSMLVSVAAYTWLWGWQFALGFVALIFVHEMGHVVVLRSQGIKASAPMFIPFMGAFVNMRSRPSNVAAEAWSGLAGPLAGSAGAVVCAWLGHALGSPLLTALAFTGFLLNLFNLMPVLPLDGGRTAGALHPAVWLLGFAGLVALEIYRPTPIVPIILVFGGLELWRRWKNRHSPASQAYFAIASRQRLAIGAAYLGLIVALVFAMHATYVQQTF